MERKVKKLNKKAAFQKELSRIKKALDEASVEITWLRSAICQNDKAHSMEKVRLTVESMRLSRLVEEVTWGVVAKQLHFRN